MRATQGTVILQPEVNWDGRIPETNHANNQGIAQTVNFRPLDKSISIAYARVRVRVDDPDFPRYVFVGQAVQNAADQVKDTWPLRRDWINYYEAPGLDIEWNTPLDTPARSARLLGRLSSYWYHMSPRPDHLFAWIPPEVGWAPGLWGDAEPGDLDQPGRVAWAFQFRGTEPYSFAKYLEQTYGFDECQIGGIGGRGYDVARREVVFSGRDGAQCFSQWTQPATWTDLRSYLAKIDAWREGITSSTAAKVEALASHGCVLVTGLITRAGPAISGELWPLEELSCTASDPQPTGSDYCIQFLSGTGEPITAHCFDIDWDPEAQGAQVRHFAYSLPLPEGIGRVLLKTGEQTLAERVASRHAPSVQVISPNGGETWSAMETVSWAAQDDDGDALSFTVLYSPDGGSTWTPLATGIEETSLEIDASRLPGGTDCIIKVEASDGIHTGEDTSDAPFSVPGHPPAVTISLPLRDATFAPGETVALLGQAYDLEDGLLSGDALAWFRGAEELGTGESAEFGPLDQGLYEIKLVATDGDGNVSMDTQTIQVGVKRLRLPLLLRG
jgi:hypothetical protein